MSAEIYYQHPLYQLAAEHFQKGDWRSGLAEVERLIQLFPAVQELRSLRNELLFKQGLDSTEFGDRAVERRQQLRRVLQNGALGVAVLAVAILAIRSYAGWIGQQLNTASERVQHQVQVAMLTAKRSDAEALIQVGRLDEAAVVLDEMTQLDPEFAGLTELRTELADERQLSDLYDQAMEQIDAANWLGARSSLEQLAALQPNYRDVDIQLTYIDRQTLVGNLISEGEAAMASGDWERAVSNFETVRTLHPDHDPEYVEQQLFDSYVNASRAVLVGQEDSLDALEQAESNLRKALALRPQDAEVKREREFAGRYLKAQSDFGRGNWSEVISALAVVVDKDPTYAQGTARQTLYDAYVARGEDQMSRSQYQGAIDDFGKAVAIAAQDDRVGLRLYEGELKLAEANGATGNYEAAVVHYRAAVEWGGLKARGADNPSLLSILQEAEAYAANGNFGVSYERYQRALQIADNTQATVTHVVVSGEYLTLLASRYGSTVRAIVEANGIENQNLIFPGQQLTIPVLP